MLLTPLHVRWQRTDLDRPLCEPVPGPHGDLWAGSVQLGAGGRTLADPSLQGPVSGAATTSERVYVTLHPNGLQALDATGEPLWHRELGVRRNGVGKPAVGPDGNVYVGALQWFGSYTPEGELRWEREVGHPTEERRVTQAPVFLADGSVVYADSRHQLQALAPDGKPLWNAQLGPITEGPLSVNGAGLVLAGCTDGLTAIRPGQAEPAWKTAQPVCMGTGASVVPDGSALFSGWDDHVNRVDADGQLIWRVPLEATPITTPTLTSDGKVVVNLSDGRLALLKTDGTLLGYQGAARKNSVRWSEAVRPVEVDGLLLCANRSGTLTALELEKPPLPPEAGQGGSVQVSQSSVSVGGVRLKKR